jgi:hypothetical protein
MDLTFTI